MKNRVFIIGGGAAGMMAAISAANEGANVTILEHNDRIGKKILSTGNGKCNFTNINQSSKCYRCDQKGFAWKVISLYPFEKSLNFFETLGIYAKERNGGLYPYSEQASAVLDVLRMEISRLKITVFTDEHVKKLTKQATGWTIQTQNRTYEADAVLLATGSKAAPKLGSDGSGYDLAKKLGHSLIPVVPALVQLKCKESFYKALAGVRVQGKVSLYVNHKMVSCDTGELQLTAYGISGIPVFQISRYASRALYEKKNVEAFLDFFPQMSEEELISFFKNRIQLRPEKTIDECLTGLFNKKLAQVMIKRAHIPFDKRVGTMSTHEYEELIKNIKQFHTIIVEPNPFDQAQICAGGINTREIDSDTMESKLVKGLFFAGEIVDVDGICGGYNLQWAWSSGYLAGKGAAHVTN